MDEEMAALRTNRPLKFLSKNLEIQIVLSNLKFAKFKLLHKGFVA
jgi:hypothetical protein